MLTTALFITSIRSQPTDISSVCVCVVELDRLRALVTEMREAAATVRAPFAWEDGPLVTAMRKGDIILIDELNLAEDAVLERLNRCDHCRRFQDYRIIRLNCTLRVEPLLKWVPHRILFAVYGLYSARRACKYARKCGKF